MKKWIVRYNGKELVCVLVQAFVSSSFRLKVQHGDMVFMIEFKNRNDFFDAKDGGWKDVKVYTLDKKVIKYGQSRFTEYHKNKENGN